MPTFPPLNTDLRLWAIDKIDELDAEVARLQEEVKQLKEENKVLDADLKTCQKDLEDCLGTAQVSQQ
jgi:peptidoglycan hydrolase CwlO-like protein